LLYALFELSLVDIFVAIGAVKIFPVIDGGRLWLEFFRFFVAVGAWNGNVAAGQCEMGLLMLRERKGRRLVSVEIVAAVASIEVGCRRKLAGVPIAVAIGALFKLHLIESVFALGDVALCAFHMRVTALKWILCRSVFLHRESRRLPALDRVAGGTFAGIGTLGELAVMGVLVAIGTFGERDLFFKVSVGVALATLDFRVLSLEWVFRFRVIEALIDVLQRDLFPTTRAMARRASLREAAVVRIFVAVGAQAEGNADIFRLAVGTVCMALRALHLGVQTG
jgi:hypothetical protein